MGDPAVKPIKGEGAEKAVPATKATETTRRWPALRELALDRVFDELMEDLDRGFRWPTRLRHRLQPMLAEAPRMAKVDVFQTDADVVVKAEIPGVSRDQIEVVVSDGRVSIKAEKSHEEEAKEQDYFRSERSFGTVQRTVDLPADVQPGKAVAKLVAGVLEVRIPKTDAAKAASVKVAVQ